MPTSRPLPVLLSDRLRRPPRSFAWLDHRLRSGGFLSRLDPEEIALYFFLALAADRQGLSCWRLDRIEREMPCFDVPALRRARDGLVRADLLAFQPWHAQGLDGSYQLLALPPADPERTRPGSASFGQLLLGLSGARR